MVGNYYSINRDRGGREGNEPIADQRLSERSTAIEHTGDTEIQREIISALPDKCSQPNFKLFCRIINHQHPVVATAGSWWCECHDVFPLTCIEGLHCGVFGIEPPRV